MYQWGRDGLVGLRCQGEQSSGAMTIRETSWIEGERLEILKNGGFLKPAEGEDMIHRCFSSAHLIKSIMYC
jgi:hypothetical protein